MPEGIQLRRTKGWRKPEGVVVVSRPSKWGNPFCYRDRTTGLVRFRPSDPEGSVDFECRSSHDGNRHDWWGPDGTVVEFHVRWATRAEIVALFRQTLIEPSPSMRIGYPSKRGHYAKCTVDEIRAELAGRDLACWCPIGQPCHRDVLLELANV